MDETFDAKTRLQASMLLSHADQLKAEAMEYLRSCGEEYTEALSEGIAAACEEESPHKRIFGILAEIGFCVTFAEAVQAAEQ